MTAISIFQAMYFNTLCAIDNGELKEYSKFIQEL